MKYKQYVASLFPVIALILSLAFVVSPVSAVEDCSEYKNNATAYKECMESRKGTQAGSGVVCSDEGNCAKNTAFAFDCGGGNNNVKTSVGISCLFITVINFLSVAVGLAVVAGVTVGGIKYSTSSGNPSGTQQGMKIIGNSLLGLVLWLLLWAITNFLIPGGVFKS